MDGGGFIGRFVGREGELVDWCGRSVRLHDWGALTFYPPPSTGAMIERLRRACDQETGLLFTVPRALQNSAPTYSTNRNREVKFIMHIVFTGVTGLLGPATLVALGARKYIFKVIGLGGCQVVQNRDKYQVRFFDDQQSSGVLYVY